MSLANAHLYLLFTPELCAGDPWATLAESLAAGVEVVQWRVKHRRDDDALARAMELCRDHGVPLIVNDDVALAAEVDAAGAHVGHDDMRCSEARELLGPDRWLGVSTHDLEQIRAAEAAGADYLGFGPCHPTATKGYDTGQTDEAIADAMAAATLPVFAIGGITADNVPRLRALGVTRIAVCAAILGAEKPGDATARLREGLR